MPNNWEWELTDQVSVTKATIHFINCCPCYKDLKVKIFPQS